MKDKKPHAIGEILPSCAGKMAEDMMMTNENASLCQQILSGNPQQTLEKQWRGHTKANDTVWEGRGELVGVQLCHTSLSCLSARFRFSFENRKDFFL